MTRRFNARVYTSRHPVDLEAETVRIGADAASESVLHDAACLAVKMHKVPASIALALRDQMRANGCDAVINRDCTIGKAPPSEVLLLGNERALEKSISSLLQEDPSTADLVEEVRTAVASFRRGTPSTPPAAELSKPIRSLYETLRVRTLVMGVLNVTPDSFSDGGLHSDPGCAVEHGIRMLEEGADLLDIGGESSRPGAEPVAADEELARVLSVVAALSSRSSVPISIDTRKPEVARAALDAGASVINDITALADPDMRSLAAERKAPCIIMHMRGTPQTMQTDTAYDDVVSEIMAFLAERVGEAVSSGLPEEHIIVDPGIGFGKSAEQNLEIIRMLGDFRSLGRPILVGTSRKAFVGKYTGNLPPEGRVFGTAATVALAIAHGASIVRVHDVREMVQVARMADAVVRGGGV